MSVGGGGGGGGHLMLLGFRGNMELGPLVRHVGPWGPRCALPVPASCLLVRLLHDHLQLWDTLHLVKLEQTCRWKWVSRHRGDKVHRRNYCSFISVI